MVFTKTDDSPSTDLTPPPLLLLLGITTFAYLESLMGKGTHENTPELQALVTSGMSYLSRAVDLHGDVKNSEVRPAFAWWIVVQREPRLRTSKTCTPRQALRQTFASQAMEPVSHVRIFLPRAAKYRHSFNGA